MCPFVIRNVGCGIPLPVPSPTRGALAFCFRFLAVDRPRAAERRAAADRSAFARAIALTSIAASADMHLLAATGTVVKPSNFLDHRANIRGFLDTNAGISDTPPWYTVDHRDGSKKARGLDPGLHLFRL